MNRLDMRLGALAVAAALTASAVPASATESRTDALSSVAAHAYPGESYAQYYRGYRGGRYGYYGRGYRYGRGYGGAAAAGVAGLAAGALIGGAIASSQAQPAYPGAPVGNVYGRDPNWVNYCASRYRSFDPASGTFLANDGNRYPCQ